MRSEDERRLPQDSVRSVTNPVLDRQADGYGRILSAIWGRREEVDLESPTKPKAWETATRASLDVQCIGDRFCY